MAHSSTIDDGSELHDPVHGQGLRARVQQRKLELERRLAEVQNSGLQATPLPAAIESALASLEVLLPNDLTHISPVVAGELSRWIESSKHLGDSDESSRKPLHLG